MKTIATLLAMLAFPLGSWRAVSAGLVADCATLADEILESPLSLADLESIGQWKPPVFPEQYRDQPPTKGLKLFPGPQLLSVNASLFLAPMIRFGAADDASPALAPYGDYWSPGAGIKIDLHLRVIAFADAYVGVAVVHHSSTGSRNWEKTIGTNV